MACPTTTAEYDGFRHYRRPSIRAKFQTHRKKSEEDLKEALKSADHQQVVLRTAPSWHSGISRCDDGSNIGKAHAVLRRHSKRLRPSWLSTSTTPTVIDQDVTSAAPSSLDLTSPSTPSTQPIYNWFPEEKWQIQPEPKLERRPAKREARRLQKAQKKEEKEAKKAADKHERKELRRRVTEARARKDTLPNDRTGIGARPEIDGEGPYPARSSTMLMWKRPLLKLGTHSKRTRHIIPMPGDFSSKADLQAYLNPVDETPSIPEIPELPAGPPPYNPLESSDLPDPNIASNSTSAFDARRRAPLVEDAQRVDSGGSSKPMLCDVCYSGIGLSDVYYHCDKCDGGDRILCSTCTEAGRRCRHPGLVARVSSVTRAAAPTPETSTLPPCLTAGVSPNSYDTDRKQHFVAEDPDSPTSDQVYAAANADMQSFEAFERVVAMLRDMKVQDDHNKAVKNQEVPLPAVQLKAIQEEQGARRRRENELSQRERAVVLREQEAALRERESALREQQASIREREATLFQRETLPGPRAPAVSNLDRADKRHDVRVMVAEVLAGSVPRIHLAPAEGHVRTHAGSKRKARTESNHSRASSNASTNSNTHRGPPGGSTWQQDSNEEEDEEDDEGPSKRQKPSPGALQTAQPQRLLACPYAKCDPIRYSERNAHEKQYRGCSGRYLTDISRLKQHLYRVHQRPEHACPRCFEVFKSKELLDFHARQRLLCPVSDCHFSEKFTEDKMKELKRKRPGKSVEESWYIIFKILFPDTPIPDSPYVDDIAGGSTLEPVPDSEIQTSNLLEIFNEQLSQHQNADTLVSREARDLINRTLAQSMAELLRRISPSNTPSVGRTPSILVSPTSAQPRPGSTLQTPATSVPPSPVTGKSGKDRRNTAPWLSPLQTDIASRREFAVPEIVDRTASSPAQMEEAFRQPATMHEISRPQSTYERDDEDIDQRAPSPIQEDGDLGMRPASPELAVSVVENYPAYFNQEHHDYSGNIGLAISAELDNFDFGFQAAAVTTNDAAHPNCPTYASHSNFRPAEVSSLNDVVADGCYENAVGEGRGNNNATTLKMTSSKRSLDSGYGSMHSRDRDRLAGMLQNVEPVHAAPAVGFDESSVDLAYLDHGMYETLAQTGGFGDTLDLEYGAHFF